MPELGLSLLLSAQRQSKPLPTALMPYVRLMGRGAIWTAGSSPSSLLTGLAGRFRSSSCSGSGDSEGDDSESDGGDDIERACDNGDAGRELVAECEAGAKNSRPGGASPRSLGGRCQSRLTPLSVVPVDIGRGDEESDKETRVRRCCSAFLHGEPRHEPRAKESRPCDPPRSCLCSSHTPDALRNS